MMEVVSHPKGSHSLANSERMVRLVNELVSSRFILNEKKSPHVSHWMPRLFTTLSLSNCKVLEFSLCSSGISRKS